MTDPGPTGFLILASFLFSCGVMCLAVKRNAVGILMGVELILNAANLNFVTFARYEPKFRLEGQVFAVIVIVLTAVNLASLRMSAQTQNLLTVVEVMGLVAIVIAGLVASPAAALAKRNA